MNAERAGAMGSCAEGAKDTGAGRSDALGHSSDKFPDSEGGRRGFRIRDAFRHDEGNLYMDRMNRMDWPNLISLFSVCRLR